MIVLIGLLRTFDLFVALMEATTQTHDSKNAEKKMRDERSYHGAIMNKTGERVSI